MAEGMNAETMEPMKNSTISIQIEMTTREKPVKMKCSVEMLMGMLLVFLDEQGKNFTVAYKIYKGRSKHYLSFDKVKRLLRPYILSWYPETGEKELIFETMEQTMPYTGIYSLGDRIHVQFSNFHEFFKGLEEGLHLTNTLHVCVEDIFLTNEEYQPFFKKQKLTDAKKRNIKRYTLVSGKRRRFTLITPKQVKEISVLRNFNPLHLREDEHGEVQVMENAPPKRIPRKRVRKKPARKSSKTNDDCGSMILPDFT